MSKVGILESYGKSICNEHMQHTGAVTVIRVPGVAVDRIGQLKGAALV